MYVFSKVSRVVRHDGDGCSCQATFVLGILLLQAAAEGTARGRVTGRSCVKLLPRAAALLIVFCRISSGNRRPTLRDLLGFTTKASMTYLESIAWSSSAFVSQSGVLDVGKKSGPES